MNFVRYEKNVKINILFFIVQILTNIQAKSKIMRQRQRLRKKARHFRPDGSAELFYLISSSRSTIDHNVVRLLENNEGHRKG